MQVKNIGRTPARVVRVVLNIVYFPNAESLPMNPPYDEERPEAVLAFLVPEDEFFFTQRNTIGGEAEIERVNSGQANILVCGYVDYVDQFGQRHRAGYGRTYDPRQDINTHLNEEAFRSRSNLALVTNRAYNYDRPREPDEPS
jgi:hypothetical protein